MLLASRIHRRSYTTGLAAPLVNRGHRQNGPNLANFGSFSAVSTPNCAIEYFMCSIPTLLTKVAPRERPTAMSHWLEGGLEVDGDGECIC